MYSFVSIQTQSRLYTQSSPTVTDELLTMFIVHRSDRHELTPVPVRLNRFRINCCCESRHFRYNTDEAIYVSLDAVRYYATVLGVHNVTNMTHNTSSDLILLTTNLYTSLSKNLVTWLTYVFDIRADNVWIRNYHLNSEVFHNPDRNIIKIL